MMTIHAGRLEDAISLVGLKKRGAVMAAPTTAAVGAVDEEVRFPAEAYTSERRSTLGIQAPIAVGGEAASVSDGGRICYMLGRSSASTAMSFTIRAILVRHTPGSAYNIGLLRRLCAERLLLASSTADGDVGGNQRVSTCAVESSGAALAVARNATVTPCGAEADGVVTTARRAAEAAPSDHLLVALAKADYQWDLIMIWNALGMRGTCISGYALRGQGGADQVLPEPYQRIHVHRMVPVALSSVWTPSPPVLSAAPSVSRARQRAALADRRRPALPN